MAMEKATRVLLSTNIFTGAPEGMVSGGVALAGNRILHVGSAAEALAMAASDAEVRDYGDQLITAGLHDSHMHLMMGCTSEHECFLNEAKSEEDAAAQLAAWFEDHKHEYADDEWLRAWGFCYLAWDDPVPPSRHSLDKYFPDRPVFINDSDLHGGWCNTRALELCGLDESVQDSPWGAFGREEGGALSGYLGERAKAIVEERANNLPEAKEERALREISQVFASYGITSVTDMLPLDAIDIGNIDLVERLEKEGCLAFRYNFATEMLDPFEKARSLKERFSDKASRIYYTGVKEFIDGIVTTHTGYLLDEYSDDPAANPVWLAMDLDEASLRIDEYQREGMNIQLHCVGDGAVRCAIDLYEHAIQANGPTEARLSIEHLDMSDPQDWARMGELGIVASVQPPHITLVDSLEQDEYRACIGPERVKHLWAFKSMWDNGCPMAFGTDFPVVPVDPRIGLNRAVARRFPDGLPREGWNPEQKLTLSDALTIYTAGGAYKVGREQELGTLEAGKLADLVVWHENLFDLPADGLLGALVDLTIFDGEVVFERR